MQLVEMDADGHGSGIGSAVGGASRLVGSNPTLSANPGQLSGMNAPFTLSAWR